MINKYKNITNYFPLIGILALFFIEKDLVHNHAKNCCINLFISLLLFSIFYCMLAYLNIDRYISVCVITIMWFTFYYIKKEYLKKFFL